MKNRHTNIVASYLILKKNTQVLLAQRANTGYQDGNFGLPSGHVEAGESFTTAMIREAKEEIGVTLSERDLSVVHVMHRKSVEDSTERVDVFFLATNWSGEVCNQEPEKCSKLGWFDVDNLPKNIVPVVKVALEQMNEGQGYSEYGWKY